MQLEGGVGVIMLAGCCWALLVLGPDAQTVKNTMQDTQHSVLKYFVSYYCTAVVACWGAAGMQHDGCVWGGCPARRYLVTAAWGHHFLYTSRGGHVDWAFLLHCTRVGWRDYESHEHRH